MRVLGLLTVAVALGPLFAAAFIPAAPLAHLRSAGYPSLFSPSSPLHRRAAVFDARSGRAGGVGGLRAGLDLATADAVIQAVNTQLPEAVRSSTEAGFWGRVVGLALVGLYCFSAPGVLTGLLDRINVKLDAAAEKEWFPDDISPQMGRMLGRGTYGVAYEAFTTETGQVKLGGAGDPAKRVVIKRCGEERQAEVEAYFNRRVRRLGAQNHFASFLGGSRRSNTRSGPSTLLVWKYEGSQTLESYLAGKDWPLNLEPFVSSSARRTTQTSTQTRAPPVTRGAQKAARFANAQLPAGQESVETRKVGVVRVVIKDVFTSLQALHAGGVINRDVKPANILISEDPNGALARMIDLGAAVDMRNGFNYDPKIGFLDPKYAPPEQYVLPQSVSGLTLFASPFLWVSEKPDRFDTYSAGMVLLQMLVPELNQPQYMKQVGAQLKGVQGDIEVWRERYGTGLDFSLADRAQFAGWDLITRLVRFDRGGRLTASGALAHRFFLPETLSATIGAIPGQKPKASATLSRSASR